MRKLSLLLVAVAISCDDPNPTTGTLVVSVGGLPTGAQASVRLTGPNEYARTIPATETVDRLAPGEYTLRVSQVEHLGALYAPGFGTQPIAVSAGAAESRAVEYALASGSLDIAIAGLPEGSHANIALKRADGFRRSIVASGVQHGLPAGTYTLEASAAVNEQGDVFGPSEGAQSVTIAPSTTPQSAMVSYSQTSGTLELAVSGLSINIPFTPVSVSGPGGYFRSGKTSQIYRGLAPGTYTVRAAGVPIACPIMQVADVPMQTVEITAAGTVQRPIAYAEGPADPAAMNLTIAYAQVIQVTQDSAGNVPILANRTALLRIYGLANQCNADVPGVRVTLSNGTVVNVPASEASVRMLPDAGTLAATWNVTIPADQVQPGLTFNAVIDPDNVIAEANEADNRYPAAGEKGINIIEMPPIGIRFVPIAQPGNGTVVIAAGTVDGFMQFSRKVHPVSSFDTDIREPLSTLANISSPSDGAAWVQILQELAARQAAEGSQRFYHGVVNVPYSGGIAGIGFIGGKAALTWQHDQSSGETVAHELGHNFAQFHAPCPLAGEPNAPAGPDPQYPYFRGQIGQYGYDAETNTLKSSTVFTDVMSYCSDSWISDYTYKRVMDNLLARQTLPGIAPTGNAEPSLLVWGRIVDGVPVLEPAFELTARAQLPAVGRHRITAYTRDGAAFDIAFAGQLIADLPGHNETFAFTVPVSALRGQPLDSLRLVANGRTVRSSMSVAVNADAQLRVTRGTPGTARVRWNATRFPVVMVRDPATGDVLSFARGGDATIATGAATQLEVNVSNRVRSVRAVRPIQ